MKWRALHKQSSPLVLLLIGPTSEQQRRRSKPPCFVRLRRIPSKAMYKGDFTKGYLQCVQKQFRAYQRKIGICKNGLWAIVSTCLGKRRELPQNNITPGRVKGQGDHLLIPLHAVDGQLPGGGRCSNDGRVIDNVEHGHGAKQTKSQRQNFAF